MSSMHSFLLQEPGLCLKYILREVLLLLDQITSEAVISNYNQELWSIC